MPIRYGMGGGFATLLLPPPRQRISAIPPIPSLIAKNSAARLRGSCVRPLKIIFDLRDLRTAYRFGQQLMRPWFSAFSYKLDLRADQPLYLSECGLQVCRKVRGGIVAALVVAPLDEVLLHGQQATAGLV